MFTAEMARENAEKVSEKVEKIVVLAEKNIEEWSKQGAETITLNFVNMKIGKVGCGKIRYELENKRGYYCVVLVKKNAIKIKLGWGDNNLFCASVEHELYKDDVWEVV